MPLVPIAGGRVGLLGACDMARMLLAGRWRVSHKYQSFRAEPELLVLNQKLPT